MKRLTVLLSILILCSCGGDGSSQNSEPIMSEKAKILYEKAEEKVSYVETRICQLNKGTDLQQVVRLLTDARNLEYHFDSTGMNRAVSQMFQRRLLLVLKSPVEQQGRKLAVMYSIK